MLERILIRNYRILKNVSLTSLAQVNLIIGKNDTGKTSLLEVIGIYASKMNFPYLFDLLREKNELYTKKGNSTIDYKRSFFSFFPNHSIEGLSDNKRLLIKTVNKGSIESHTLSLKIIGFVENENGKDEIDISQDASIIHKVGLKIDNDDSFVIYSKDDLDNLKNSKIQSNNSHFIKSKIFSLNFSKKQWDKVISLGKEKDILEMLQIINPNIERIGFELHDGSQEKGSIGLQLQNEQTYHPIESMGTGISQLFLIILNLVNAENEFLLIDNIENGLHNGLYEKLWKTIFKLSEELNVQVFATTQSHGCIKRFGQMLENEEYHKKGKMIRLDKVNNDINEVNINADELKIALENNIDLR